MAKRSTKSIGMNNDRSLLHALMDQERLIGNDWHWLHDIGLTETPALGYGSLYDEHDPEEPSGYESVWYYPNYQVEHFGDVLIRDGYVVFNKVKEEASNE